MGLFSLIQVVIVVNLSVSIAFPEFTWLHVVAYAIIGLTGYRSKEFELHTKWFSFKSTKKK